MTVSTGKKGKRGKGRVTLSDVAQRAGTSAITASRVLNDPNRVSAKLRERVQQAVLDTGYRPNQAARMLAGSRSYTLAVIIPSLSNAVFSSVIKGIYDVCSPANYEIMIGNTYYSGTQERALLDKFIHHMPDGIIMSGLELEPETRKLLKDAGIPVVQIMETADIEPIDMCVGISHHATGVAMAEYLLEKGYRAPALLASQLDRRTQLRMQGFLERLGQADVSQRRVITNSEPSSVHLGGRLLGDLLAVHPDTDAVFCCNDDLAWGAIYECHRRHLKIPSQIAIAGFNDLEPSACINPTLTSIAIPLYEIGANAAHMMLARLQDETLEAPRRDLGFVVQKRESA
ncbi:MAG: LacI family DNA-binding transcriptional regulator [Natronospirillum sp.]